MLSSPPRTLVPALLSLLEELSETLRSIPGQVQLMLGRRGVVLASAAAVVGMLCCAGALADVLLSLRADDVAHQRGRARQVLELNQNDRTLMRRLFVLTANVPMAVNSKASVGEAWQRVQGALDRLCRPPAGDAAPPAGVDAAAVREICTVGDALESRFAAEVAAFDRASHPIDPEVLRLAMLLSQRINAASTAVALESDSLVGRMAEHYGRALVVLALSTIGFAAAGVILIGLVGRASMLFQAQTRAAGEARDRLRETIDALPAGVVLYDRDERLVMFNRAAADIVPGLAAIPAIGMTQAEISRRLYELGLEAAVSPEGGPQDWIARFRSRGARTLRRAPDGRWIEWSEVTTASGGTVGLRIDVTELKRRELEAERSRDLLQETIDALPVGVALYDPGERLVMFNSAAVAAASIFARPGVIGMTFEQIARENEKLNGPLAATADEAIARFRSKGERWVRQPMGKRWFEFSEQTTRSGYTVGIRVDITELKNREIETVRSRDLLQETIDALPAGVVLYDQDERLVMFNSTAVVASPIFAQPDVVGQTFEAIARANRRMTGPLGQSPEDALARFRSKGERLVRQRVGDRWFEFSERATRSGRTVGLRIDVTELKNRELEVERSRDALQETIDALPVGIVLYDRDERLAMVNRAAVTINPNYRDPRTIGLTYGELVRDYANFTMDSPDAPPVAPEHWMARFRSKGIKEVRQLKDGRWIEWSEVATPSGATVGLRVDVTDLKKRELELERVRDVLQETIDALPVGVVLYDRDERLVMFNRAVTTINPDFNDPGVIGKTHAELVRAFAAQGVEAAGSSPIAAEQWIARFRSRGAREVRKLKDGRWIEWREVGTPSGGTVGLRFDVTDLKNRELEVLRTRDTLRETIDALPVGIVLFDRDDRLVMFNAAAVTINPSLADPRAIGHTYEQIARDFSSVAIEASEASQWVTERRLARYRSKGAREVRPLKDGRWIEWSEVATPSGGTVGLRFDVTGLKKRELEVLRTRDLLQETIDALSVGILLYDRDERLIMFNDAAVAATPLLRQPDVLGITYEELAYRTAGLADEFRAPLDSTPGQWIARFRSKGALRARQQIGERWFEFSEHATRSGNTVGMRVDVTDLKMRELEAERARALLQETIDALPAGVVLYDRDERLLMFNKAAAEVTTSLRLPGTIGMTYSELVHRMAGEVGKQGFALADPPAALIAQFRDGRRRLRKSPEGGWIEWSEVVAPSGNTIGLRVDVTALKEHELAAQQARSDYAWLVDSLSDVVFRVDVASRLITFASAATNELFGLPPSEMVGRVYQDFIVPEDRPISDAAARASRTTGGEVRDVQYRMKGAHGTVRNVEVRFRRAPDASGADTIWGVIRDVSERVALAERLDEEMARLRSIVQSSSALIVLTDRDFNILMVNREFEQLHGVVAADVVGRRLTDVVQLKLEPAVFGRWLAGPLGDEDIKPLLYIKELYDPAGRRRVLNMTAMPIVDAERRARQIVFLGVDDTERREAEQALQHSERLATIGEMAATVAHEIAQPLQVIDLARSGAEEELAEAARSAIPLDASYLEERLRRIGQQIQRANRIVSDLRAFVRRSSTDEPGAVDPAEAVRGAIDLTKHALREAGVIVWATVDEGLPVLSGRVGGLEQVLINLINNARDAGASVVEIGAALQERDGWSAVRIAVSDNGPGVPPAVLPKLFEQFITTKPRGAGTGLGLRICRRIVEEMGGTIAVANRPEGGARFEILLPVGGGPSEA